MSTLVHRIYIATLVSIVLAVTVFLAVSGFDYYRTPLEERFYHAHHDWFKPSGAFGHGLGIVGTLLILIGVFGYMGIKRTSLLSKAGRLKYWLEFHIFLCTLGPVMILFHTAFKFGGIVSVSFWSMVAVVASGVVGRFIYVQIPRSIEGRELSLSELHAMRVNLAETLRGAYALDAETVRFLSDVTGTRRPASGNLVAGLFHQWVEDRRTLKRVRSVLKGRGLPVRGIAEVVGMIRGEITLNNRIERLQVMVRLFRYWHVAHLPFALVMLIIMVIHVIVTLLFGYRWIF